MKTLFAGVFFLTVSLSQGQTMSDSSITLVTHNVLAFSGHPKNTHDADTLIVSRAITFYKSLKSDILVIQESPSEAYVKTLAGGLGFHYFYLKAKFSGNKEYPYGFPGCILSKYPIRETFDYNEKFPQLPDSIFARHWGGVKIETPLGLIQVHSVHLCANWGGKFRESTRMAELSFLLKEVQTCGSCLANIIAGDFNSEPTSKPYKLMTEHGFIDSHVENPEPTVPVPNPKYRIDYVFIEKGNNINIQPQPTMLPYYDDVNLYLSDHYPCMVKMRKKQ